jgi:hypothetical protein
MTADALTARPGTFVVSTGRCGSTMLTNMLRLNPDILSLSEFFSLLLPDPLVQTRRAQNIRFWHGRAEQKSATTLPRPA